MSKHRFMIRIASEISLKSNFVRKIFVNRLIDNLKAAMDKEEMTYRISQSFGRLYLSSDQNEKSIEILSSTFGVDSFSPLDFRCPSKKSIIIESALKQYKEVVQGKSFAVRVKRSDVTEYTSQDLAIGVGAALFPFAKKVDLKSPEVEIGIESRQQGTFFFSSRHKGPGGMPIGVQGKALCLLSGGYDSAVAAWMILKRGVACDFLFCNLAAQSYERSVLRVAKALTDRWCHGYHPVFYSSDFSSIKNAILARATPRLGQVLLKRMMYRLAEGIARQNGYAAVVTGEAIGQVSSQTLLNLATIEEAVKIPVLRPLISFDKNEIVALSRTIGTAPFSEHVEEYCQLSNAKPATSASVLEVVADEKNVDTSDITGLVRDLQSHQLNELASTDLLSSHLFCKTIPEGFNVIDCREQRFYNQWHYPGATHFALDDILINHRNLDKNKRYVIYCPLGLQSALAAEKLQDLGFEAYSFLGGTRALQKLAHID